MLSARNRLKMGQPVMGEKILAPEKNCFDCRQTRLYLFTLPRACRLSMDDTLETAKKLLLSLGPQLFIETSGLGRDGPGRERKPLTGQSVRLGPRSIYCDSCSLALLTLQGPFS